MFEQFAGWILVCFVSLIAALIFMCCKSYRHQVGEEILKEELIRLKTPASIGPEMSMDDVAKLVEDRMFWDMLQEYAEGKGTDLPLDNGEDYVEVLVPCEHHDCVAHETREDCCKTSVTKDGIDYCRIYVNLSKLTKANENTKPSYATTMTNDPRLLTDEEIKTLEKVLTRYNKGEY